MSWRVTQIVPKTNPVCGQSPLGLLLGIWLLGVLLFALPRTATAQWFTLPNFTESRAVLPTPDGGFIAAGRRGVPAIGMVDDAYLTKLDPDGRIQWEGAYGGNDAENIVALTLTTTGDYAFTGFTNSFDVNGTDADVFVGLVDPDSNLRWQRSLGGIRSDRGNGIAATPDGGLIVTGCWDCFGPSELYLLKLDVGGNVEWAFHDYQPGYTAEGFAVRPTADGGYAVTGWVNQGGSRMLFLLKTDAAGQLLWQEVFGGLGDDQGRAIVEAANGDLLVAGYSWSNNFTAEDVYLLRTDALGSYRWHRYFGEASTGDFAFAVEELPDGDIVVAGSTWSFGAVNGDVYLFKTDAQGNEIWSRTYGSDQEETGRSIATTASGDLLVAGIDRTFEMGMMVGSSGLVLRADPQGRIDANLIRGNVYHDLNADCVPQAGEEVLANWIVRLEGNGEEVYATTDVQGDYEFRVDPGDYQLSLLPPTYNWESCLAPLDILVTGPTDTLDFTLPARSIIAGSYLEVDVSAASLSTCTSPVYFVNYCNRGPQTASDAEVRIDLDSYFTFLSSSISGSTPDGRRYFFPIGDVAPGDCGRFEVVVDLDCGATEGLTHCLEAHIQPNSIDLPPDPTWDAASLTIEADCQLDSTVFTLRNVGTGDMDGPQYYIVIEDDLVLFTGPIDLEAGEFEVFKYPARGKTYRMEVDQSPGHPGRSRPSATWEACGTGDNGAISLGYVTQFPEDDADFFVSVDCQENRPDFAPFEKRAYPKGTTDQHYIDANTDLEYHLRFQNTTSDTVTTVIIRDTLSPFLDWGTIAAGASSHPYHYELYGAGILKFTFSHLALPPAATDPTASVGFVKFRVRQLADNPAGTRIRNRSTLYLDWEVPQPSPEVFHTIRPRTVYATTAEQICAGDSYRGQVYTESTLVYDTLRRADYDSITIIQLTVNAPFRGVIDTSICAGELFEIGGFQYGEAGIYEALFVDRNGCDSLYEVQLAVLEQPSVVIRDTLCAGDSLVFNGNVYTVSGEYLTQFPASNGCDSSVHLALRVLDSILTRVDTALYIGAVYQGIRVNADTSFTQVYAATNGCDSLVLVHVLALTTGLAAPGAALLEWRVFPNPVRDVLNLRYYLGASSPLRVEVFTLRGHHEVLFQSTGALGPGFYEHRFAFADYPPGTYLLRISTNGGQQIRKVIKWD
ncbi:MAG: T9SS type A sorting domain-containing protein [Bacteroidota bacterium]